MLHVLCFSFDCNYYKISLFKMYLIVQKDDLQIDFFTVDFSTYLDEDFVWKMLIQMTSALKECHRRKNGKAVLHRDLKPANIFLDSDNNVKLGDFGLARVLHHETSFAKTFVGTPYYMSPVSLE